MTMNGNNFSIHKISNAHHFLPHNFEKSREGEGLKVRMNVSKGEKSGEREGLKVRLNANNVVIRKISRTHHSRS